MIKIFKESLFQIHKFIKHKMIKKYKIMMLKRKKVKDKILQKQLKEDWVLDLKINLQDIFQQLQINTKIENNNE